MNALRCLRCGTVTISRFRLPICRCGLVLDTEWTRTAPPTAVHAPAIGRTPDDPPITVAQHAPQWLDDSPRPTFALVLGLLVLLAGLVGMAWLFSGLS